MLESGRVSDATSDSCFVPMTDMSEGLDCWQNPKIGEPLARTKKQQQNA